MGDKASSLDICELRRMVDPERVEAVRALMPHDRYVDPRCRQTTGRRPPRHPPRAFRLGSLYAAETALCAILSATTLLGVSAHRSL